MSNQIDVGWSAPPFGCSLDEGKIRIIAVGNDATVFKGQTVPPADHQCADLAGAQAGHRAVHEGLPRDDRLVVFGRPAALKTYADFVGISVATAKRTRDGFFPKAAVDPDTVVGLDQITQDAVTLKCTAAQLTKEQRAERIQIPPRR
jgi:NitT/TauT family transport system substrate-binding protein